MKNKEKLFFIHEDRPLVSIIIPVYNQWDYTSKCLFSIFEKTKKNKYEIIIADDLSTDRTKNIDEFFSNITVLKNKKNLGFLQNCNNAAKHAKGNYLLFLNNDTEVTEGWLESLVDLVEADSRIGLVGAKLVYPDGKLQEAGGIVWNDASGLNYGRDDDPENPEYNYVRDVDYISGACIMISKELWDTIGGFDERFSPAYYEDTDLAFTVRKLGYRVVFQPKSVVIHFEGKSHGTDLTAGIKSYQVRNQGLFFDKWKDVLQKDHFKNGEHLFWARDKSRDKKTVVFVDYQVPHFDKFAGSRTNFMYLKLLVEMGFNVKFMGIHRRRDEPYTTELERLGIEALYGEIVFGDQAGEKWHRERWQSWILEHSAYVDFIFLNKPEVAAVYMPFLMANTHAKIVFQGHDLHYLRLRRKYEVDENLESLEESRRFEELEYDIMRKSDVVLTFSEYEQKVIQEKLPDKEIVTVPLYFYENNLPGKTEFSTRKNILFVGGFSHSPNVDGVVWFAKKILPKVLGKIPEITFCVAGMLPPEYPDISKKIRELDSAHVKIMGHVSEEELARLYSEVKMVVIPLRFGAGVKGKTLEALYNGVPVVSTSIGLEGLVAIKKILQPMNTEDEFADEIVSLYHDEDRLCELSRNSQEYVKEHFCMKKARNILADVFSGDKKSSHVSITSSSEEEKQPKERKARLISFYLPQFHPIPENDLWWGKGFTEWTNVSKSKPLFPGHHQPQLPTDLGFYDLRLPEAREAQAVMARKYGIEAFCYYHYWFKGKRLLERPFNDVLKSGEPDFPFCLAWANESWSRRWLGEERDILMEQAYSAEDDQNHIHSLLPAFADSRYLKVNGRPLFLIYRPNDLPEPKRTTDLFRNTCIKQGLKEPFLVGINSHCWDLDCRTIGFDETLLFLPQLGNLPDFMEDEPSGSKKIRNQRFGIHSSKLKVYDYQEALTSMLANREKYDHPVIPSIFVGWDNTPRRGENGIIIVNSSAEIFGKTLSTLIESVQHKPADERIVFVNAWNEWAEGNHLEPDNRNKHSYLEEIDLVNDIHFTEEKRESKVKDEISLYTPSCQEDDATVLQSKVRTIAFFLPQYHPIPENDRWWGKGFTEWTNVAQARPLFPGHFQPHIPADLGFYDLRLPGIRQKQAELAKKYRVNGFCYYHYWFNGKLLLETPLHDMLESGEPDFPFCLCWANEPWTRAWDGRSGEVLIDQNYCEEDDRKHLGYLSRFFKDPRYIKINGKPLFLVYRASHITDPAKAAATWRDEARKLGIGEIYLCRVESFPDEHTDPATIGFDAAVEFQPDWTNLSEKLTNPDYGDHCVYDYESVVKRMIMKSTPPYKRFHCVTPSWDNSPRRKKNAYIFINSKPHTYEMWLYNALLRTEKFKPDERLVFINAWNEWGEGNYLEPDQEHGRAYLEATRNAIRNSVEIPYRKSVLKIIDEIGDLFAQLKNVSGEENLLASIISEPLHEISDKALSLVDQEQQVFDHEQYVKEQEHSLAGLSRKFTEYEHRLREREQQLNERDKRINELLNSYSWKVTAPLRRLLDIYLRK